MIESCSFPSKRRNAGAYPHFVSVRNLPCHFASCRAEHFYATGAVETNSVGAIEVKHVPLTISPLAHARASRLQAQPSFIVNPDAFARRLLGTSTTAVVQRSALNYMLTNMTNVTNVTDGWRQPTAAPVVRLLSLCARNLYEPVHHHARAHAQDTCTAIPNTDYQGGDLRVKRVVRQPHSNLCARQRKLVVFCGSPKRCSACGQSGGAAPACLRARVRRVCAG